MTIIITSKHDGFRRCGIAHPAKPTIHDADAFTPEELEILKAEPMLVVQEIDTTEKEKTPAKKKAESKSKVEPQKVKPSEVPPMPTKPANAEELMAAIVGVIGDLDEETDFTAAGAPRVAAVAEKLGYDVSGEEVSIAFDQYNKDNK